MIKKIVIVGGGSAGWMSAAYLNKALNSENQRVEISLIESNDIPSVGVGEATIPILHQYFSYLGIPEQVWMEACNATFKLAIKFDCWYDNSDKDSYWHTFGSLSHNKGGKISLMHHWLHNYLTHKTDVPFAQSVHEVVAICEAKKCPKIAFANRQHNLPYAYHLDAGLLANFLKRVCIRGGVKHYKGKVLDVIRGENGHIDYVRTDSEAAELKADLFVDCSGFQSILLDKTLQAEYVSYSDSLLCDRAIAIGTLYPEEDLYNVSNGGINPYTTATARSAGWTWHTPLITRAGNGYVFSSNFQSDADAIEEFERALDGMGKRTEPRVIPFKTGTYKNHWVKNCVGIGLAAGFIEPLESTGLAMIQIGLQNLVYNFPDENFNPVHQRNFNRTMQRFNENIRDFIVLHYLLTQREDTPFWEAVKHETVVPDSLQQKLDQWKLAWTDLEESPSMFGIYNYVSILTGMHYLPEKSYPLLEYYQIEETYNRFQRVKVKGENLAKQLHTHGDFFSKIKKIKEYQASSF